MKIGKMAYIIAGFIMLGIGSIGIIIPILPTVPFLLVAAMCLSKSSEKLDKWFKETAIYKKHLESYVRGEGMGLSSKIKLIVTISTLMIIGFYFMSEGTIGRIVLTVVWLLHLYYFIFKVETLKEK